MNTTQSEKHRINHEISLFAKISRYIANRRKHQWQNFFEVSRSRASVIHVNDCADDDSRTRLVSRSSELLGTYAGFIGIRSDIEAAGGIITALDGLTGSSEFNVQKKKHKNVILANTAPREGDAKKYENGTPFCYFWYEDALIVSTLDGKTLSLVKKLRLTDSIYVLDIHETLRTLQKSGMISEDEERRIAETQFRSLEFSPRVAAYLLRYRHISGAQQKFIADIPEIENIVWHVDTFARYGNCKTTLLPEDVFSPDIVLQLASGGVSDKKAITAISTRFGILPVYRRLKDVPNGELAVIVGSSGLGNKRFLEIVVQGGSAAKKLGLSIGDPILP